VFANAGVAKHASFGEITEELYDSTFDINVKGLLFTVQKALPLLPDGASIVLNASIVGSIGSKGLPSNSVYSATKAAVRSFADLDDGFEAAPHSRERDKPWFDRHARLSASFREMSNQATIADRCVLTRDTEVPVSSSLVAMVHPPHEYSIAIATFVMHYSEPRRPTQRDQEVIDQITHLAGAAIQQKLAEEKLQRSEAYLAQAQKLTHTGSWAWDPAPKTCSIAPRKCSEFSVWIHLRTYQLAKLFGSESTPRIAIG
jgi:hypothetical protein